MLYAFLPRFNLKVCPDWLLTNYPLALLKHQRPNLSQLSTLTYHPGLHDLANSPQPYMRPSERDIASSFLTSTSTFAPLSQKQLDMTDTDQTNPVTFKYLPKSTKKKSQQNPPTQPLPPNPTPNGQPHRSTPSIYDLSLHVQQTVLKHLFLFQTHSHSYASIREHASEISLPREPGPGEVCDVCRKHYDHNLMLQVMNF